MSCEAAAEFSQGRKPLGLGAASFKAPEGRQRACVNVIDFAAYLFASRR
jgi:hypothetical protein